MNRGRACARSVRVVEAAETQYGRIVPVLDPRRIFWCLKGSHAILALEDTMIIEIRAAEGGSDAKLLVETMLTAYAARATRSGL